MELDLQTIINGVVLLIVGGGIRWAVGVSKELNNLKIDVERNRTHLSDSYVKKDDLRQVLTDVVSPINQRLDIIWEDLKRFNHKEINK